MRCCPGARYDQIPTHEQADESQTNVPIHDDGDDEALINTGDAQP